MVQGFSNLFLAFMEPCTVLRVVYHKQLIGPLSVEDLADQKVRPEHPSRLDCRQSFEILASTFIKQEVQTIFVPYSATS